MAEVGDIAALWRRIDAWPGNVKQVLVTGGAAIARIREVLGMELCSSGKHGWINPADAERCCNGWHQVTERVERPHGGEYRLVWVRDEKEQGGQEGQPRAGSAATSDELLLTIELMPEPLWGRSLAKMMPRAEWDRLRGRVKAMSDYRCAICGAEGALFCHEVWRYDDAQRIQSLTGFKAICRMCHHVKHIGHAGILASEGKLDMEDVEQHFMRVNGCDREAFERHKEEAGRIWEERSRHQWTTDFGEYAASIHPPQVDPGELADAERPSMHKADFWLYAERRRGTYPEATERNGKWMVFPTVAEVDGWWAIIKKATEEGRLGSSAKVATARPNSLAISDSERLICVYTYDGLDKADVMRVREELRALGVTWPISYKLDSDTLAGQYAATGARVSLYRV